MWTSIAITAVTWIIDKLIFNDAKRIEMKKKFYKYTEHWEKNREKTESISDDVDWLNKKMDSERDKESDDKKS